MSQQATLRLEGVALGAQLPSKLQLAHRHLLQINSPVEQVVETPRGEDELEPAHAAERIERLDVGLEGPHMLQVRELIVRQLQLGVGDLRFNRLRLGGDRGQVGIALRQLHLQPRECQLDLALLSLQRREPLMLPRLLLLNLCQPIGERAGIIRVRGHGGDKEQQRQQGAARSGDYAGGAPAEPGIPGSRRGVKPASPLKGAGAPLGAFSFFFFFTSRLPLSRDFAMVPCLPDLVRRAAILPSIGLAVHATATLRGRIAQDLEARHHRITQRVEVVTAFQGPDRSPVAVGDRPALDHPGEFAVGSGGHVEARQRVVLMRIEAGRHQEQLRLEGIERRPDFFLPGPEERPIRSARRERHV